MSKYSEQEKAIPAIVSSDDGIDVIELCEQVYGSSENVYQKALWNYLKKHPNYFPLKKRGYITRIYTSEIQAVKLARPLTSIAASSGSRKRTYRPQRACGLSDRMDRMVSAEFIYRQQLINGLWVRA